MPNSVWKDGLPGVGVVCEYKSSKGKEYKKCTLSVIGEKYALASTNGNNEFPLCLSTTSFRPIKKREPKAGEVWLIDGNPTVFQASAYGTILFPFVRLDGEDAYATDSDCIEEYAAPSVKAYIARGLFKSAYGMRADTLAYDLYEKTRVATRPDEE